MKKVLYFGYGANRDPRILSVVLGRKESDFIGTPAIIKGYKLVVQKLNDIPDTIIPTSPVKISPRELLEQSWDDKFNSYIIKQDAKSAVSGILWEITEEERERIKDWELVDFGWPEECQVLASDNLGNLFMASTERMISDQDYDHEVDGINYDTWLNPFEKSEKVAIKAKREYDLRQKLK